ncbi:MAG: lipid-binding SYLF domain-containing protein [Pyrinomonadaceae bacterium]
MKGSICTVILSMLGLFVLAGGANAQGRNPGKELKAAVDRVDKASDVVEEVLKVRESAIPSDLMDKAKAIVIFPGAVKAAFIVGGQGGKGVAIRRVGKGWSAPAFVNMGGGSVGFQIGGQKTDYILLIMNNKGLKNLLEDKFEIGGEGSVAAGPVGRTAAASTNATMDAEILTYSRTKGIFAGISLKGVVLSQDQDMNLAVYQKSAKQILGEPPVTAAEAPASLRKLSETLQARVK